MVLEMEDKSSLPDMDYALLTFTKLGMDGNRSPCFGCKDTVYFWIKQIKGSFSFAFRSIICTFELRSKIGCISEKKRKLFFSFAFRSICTTFAAEISSNESKHE